MSEQRSVPVNPELDKIELPISNKNIAAVEAIPAINEALSNLNGEPLKPFSFSVALHYLKKGKKVARKGWNGKGMFLIQAGGYSVPADKLRSGTHITPEFLASRGVTEMVIVPHIDMWTAQNTYVTG